MAIIITALFHEERTIDNAVQDLVGVGIPRDRIATQPEHKRVSVTIGDQAEPEITEILNRHQPTELHSRTMA